MLVCTLPSPACMCSATNTRLRSTCGGSRRSPRAPARTPGRRRSAPAARASRASTTRGSCGPAAGGTASRLGSWRERGRPDSPAGCPSPTSVERVAQRRQRRVDVLEQERASARVADDAVRAPARRRCGEQLVVGAASSRPAPRARGSVRRVGEQASSASSTASLLRVDSSMLIRSMPSVYSPIRGSGITTSSLILNALVWRAIAAVRARSSQNVLRASADTATKPSPQRALAIRTTSRGRARATASSSSPTMSPISTILGRPPRRDLVV